MHALRHTAPLAALALLAAGCAKDLELPPRSTAPVLAALSPAAAYAGQLVRLQGSGLDPEPSANVVTFAAATARGLRFDGAALVVRVPDDAGSGPVILANGRGTSAPFGAFDYLGLGEPRRRALTSGLPVLHGPAAVHGVAGDVFVDSSVYEGLLSSADGSFATPRADLSAAADWKGALFTAEFSTTTWSRATLSRVAAAGGARTGPVTIPFIPTALVTLRGADVVAAFASSGSTVAAWDLDTLDPVLAPTEVSGLGEYFAVADVRDGRAVAAVYDYDWSAGDGGVRLALLDFRNVRDPPPAPPFPPAVLLPGAFEAPTEMHVAVGVTRVAANGIPAGEPLGAVTLFGGDLGVARLGTDPAFVGTVETFSPSAVGGLAGAATVPVVLAAKPADGLSLGADLQAQTLVWSIADDGPGPASAAGDVAFVAHAGDNDVSVVNLSNGSKIARISFDVGPWRPAAVAHVDGLAFLPRDPADAGSQDLLFFASSRFPGLLRFSVDARGATCVLRERELGPLAALPDGTGLWAGRGGASPALQLLGDRGEAAPVTTPLPGVPTTLSPGAASVAVGLAPGGGTMGGGGLLALAGPGGLAGTVSTNGLGLAGLGFTADGRVWAVPHVGSADAPQLWDPAQLGTGGAPAASTSFPTGTASSALWLEDGLWLLGRGSGPWEGLLLGPDLAVARRVPLAGQAPFNAAASPNGRLLVERQSAAGGAVQSVLRFYRADPELGFPLVDTQIVDGLVEGLHFDGTGERLWIVTRSPDRVLVMD